MRNYADSKQSQWQGGRRSGHMARPAAQPRTDLLAPVLPRPHLCKIFRVRNRWPRGWRGGETPGPGGRPCASRPQSLLPARLCRPRPGDAPWRSRRCQRPGLSGGREARGQRPPRQRIRPEPSLRAGGWAPAPLLCGLFFSGRISGNPTEIGSIEHLPNPPCLLSIYQSTFLIRLIRSALECR